MEFLRIRGLKADLARESLSASETAKYLAAQAALSSIVLIPTPADTPSGWPFLAYPLLALTGVYYCYKRNGGTTGERFAERYLAVGWVAGVRVATALVVIAVVGLTGLAFTDIGLQWLEHSNFAAAVDAGMFVVLAFIYWRIGAHLADVQRMSA
jgi:hypothetical protein